MELPWSRAVQRKLAGFTDYKNDLTYLADILCIHQLLERKNWKMFPADMVGMYRSLSYYQIFL